jgi:hypothetical protein
MNKLTVENTLKEVEFLCSIMTAVKKSLSDDGKITIGDIFKFAEPASKLFPAIFAIGNTLPELKDEITVDEKNQIVTAIVKSEVIPVDSIEGAEKIFADLISLKNHLFEYVI